MSMSGYTKLFNSILASTIWRESHATRIVWITLLAMADKHGVAEGSVPGLADFARVSIPECRKALAALMAPDEDSRSKEHDGRRIEAVDGGWQLLNHAKYRAKMGADERREYLRQKQADYRKRLSTKVNNVSDTDTLSTHAEAEAYTEAIDQDPATTEEPRADAPVALLSDVRRHLLSACHGILDRTPNVEDGELSEQLKCIAARDLQVQDYDGRSITQIIDAVRGWRGKRNSQRLMK